MRVGAAMKTAYKACKMQGYQSYFAGIAKYAYAPGWTRTQVAFWDLGWELAQDHYNKALENISKEQLKEIKALMPYPTDSLKRAVMSSLNTIDVNQDGQYMRRVER